MVTTGISAGQELVMQLTIKEDKMKSIQKMKGATLLGILIIALLVIFVSVIVIRLFPSYMGNYEVKDALKSLAATPDVAQLSRPQMRDLLSRKLHASYVKGVTAENLEVIKGDNNQLILKMKYESRVHLMGNVDAVMSFDNEEVLRAQ